MLDICPQVTINKCEYEKLVRESEKMNIIRKNLTENQYFSTGDLMIIAGVEKEDRKENK